MVFNELPESCTAINAHAMGPNACGRESCNAMHESRSHQEAKISHIVALELRIKHVELFLESAQVKNSQESAGNQLEVDMLVWNGKTMQQN